MDSYIRRQTWLQRSQAVQVINAYGEAMSGGKGSAPSRAPVAMQPDDDILASSIKVT